MISQKEKEYLRELAKEYKKACMTPENDKKRQKWYDINDLKKGTKPVFINHYWPLAMDEVLPQDTYFCKDEVALEFEQYFRFKMFYAIEMDDDNVLEPVVYSRVVQNLTKFKDIEGLVKHIDDDELKPIGLSNGSALRAEEGDAYEFVCVLNDESDIEKISEPVLFYDEKKSREYYDEACEIFEPILTVIRHPMHIGTRAADEYSWLRGLENTYMDMYDEPEFMHKALKKIQANLIKRFELYRDAGIWGTPDLSYPLGSAGLRYVSGMPDFRDIKGCAFEHRTKLEDSWGFTSAELFTCVSNEMHKEFDYEYNKEVTKMFKFVNVGCCEVLDRKIELMPTFENARKISVSEWCDHELAAKSIADKYVYSYRAAGVHFIQDEWDKDAAEKEIRSVLENSLKYGCITEIVLNIGGTLKNNAKQKVIEWSKMVKGLIAEYYDGD